MAVVGLASRRVDINFHAYRPARTPLATVAGIASHKLGGGQTATTPASVSSAESNSFHVPRVGCEEYDITMAERGIRHRDRNRGVDQIGGASSTAEPSGCPSRRSVEGYLVASLERP